MVSVTLRTRTESTSSTDVVDVHVVRFLGQCTIRPLLFYFSRRSAVAVSTLSTGKLLPECL